jgi:aspartyl-tRNA(Asn)/glutamyl-tRNA(Gln) amidotransferase subunit A
MPLGPYATALEIGEAIRRGDLTAEAACQAALDRIGTTDTAVRAFVHVGAERALTRARALDASGEPAGPLHGVPVALKDNLVSRGGPTTAGSRILDGYHSPYDASVVRALEDAGAVILGKTVCDEFAMGSSTEHAATGPARNPWNTDRTPGGSSGGSAVAVATGMAPLALGSDTGGSIRQPAAMCGVVGLKPTYGRVSRYGLVAFASSLDQVGPMARSVADVARTLDVISGPDPNDSTAASVDPPRAEAALTGNIAGLNIGVPRALIDEGIEPDVLAAFEAGLDVLTRLGATVSTVELPNSRHATPVYYVVAMAEASSNLARYDGVRYGHRAGEAASVSDMYDRTRREGFGAEVKRRVMLGTYVLSAGYYDAYYLKAQQVRTLIRRDFDDALAGTDAIAMPTSPVPAFRLGERTSDPVQMYLADIFTVGASLAGLPAVSVPGGFTSDRLPVGLQLIGRAWDEATILRVAHAYEGATDWHTQHPAT